MRFLVVIRRTGTGYSVDVPVLPGCVATGTTVEHALDTIGKAIEMHLDLMRRSGEPTPPPDTSNEFSVSDNAAEESSAWVEVHSPEP